MRMDDDGGNLIKRDATNLNSVRTDFQKTSLARQVTPITGDINDPIQIENPKFTLLIAGSVTRFFESCKSGQIFICPGSRMRPISSTNMRLIFDFTSVLAPI